MPWSTDGEELDGITLKGLTIKLDHDASVCFDTDLCRYAAGWTDGWLTLMGTPFDGTHRPPERSRPAVKGELLFGSSPRPGASLNGNFRDPRAEPFGPLPKELAQYKGLYLHGKNVTLSYRVGDCDILETPQAVKEGKHFFITRTLTLSPSEKPLSLLVCEQRNDFGHRRGYEGLPPSHNGSIQTVGDLIVGRSGTTAEMGHWSVLQGRQVVLNLPASDSARHLRIVIGRDAPASALSTVANKPIDPPRNLTEGTPGRYPEIVTTKGIRGEDKGPFAIDTLTLPDKNPWHSWLKVGGFDFFSDGKRAALCTWAGDVWTVTGIDSSLSKLRWRRFATGLFQPLGLKIVDDKIYALGRDQITRLHDTNNDGEADFYECFNNDVCVTANFHEFCFGLETDPAGNFYFSKGAPLLGTHYFDPISRHNGCLLKVSADGKTLERFASGLRAPNGVGVGPNGEVTCGDNEGIWTPVCRLNWMVKGGFYGCQGMSHRNPAPQSYDPPLCWLPFAVDNSTGGQVWVPKNTWGPLAGELIHLSYGQVTAFHALTQKVGEVMQGGVVRLPLNFVSGSMRGRFHPKEPHLYVAGLRGWQSRAARDGSLQRVRRTAQPLRRLSGVAFHKASITLEFTTPLDRETAGDLESYQIQQWNYRWSKEYGSDHYSVTDPAKKVGRKGELKGDPVKIASAKLSADGKSVTLTTQPLQPVMQIAINIDLEGSDGSEIVQDYYGTINALPK